MIDANVTDSLYKETLLNDLTRYLSMPFTPCLDGTIRATDPVNPPAIFFSLPTVKTYCDSCHSIEPHNPQSPQCIDPPLRTIRLTSQTTVVLNRVQLYTLPYHCQACKRSIVVFFVERNDDKFTISGRSPFERVIVPSFIPKEFAKHISGAIVASHCGATLCGLFLLRVFIEQYSVSFISDSSTNCDVAIDRYMETLPRDFKDRFPSLREIYDLLSRAIHNASADPALFDEQLKRLYKHFDAKRVYGL